jgi:hypothetical protein
MSSRILAPKRRSRKPARSTAPRPPRRSAETLNPYDQDAIPRSILKIEADNFENRRQRQLWCLAISAKRYALLVRRHAGRWSRLVE